MAEPSYRPDRSPVSLFAALTAVVAFLVAVLAIVTNGGGSGGSSSGSSNQPAGPVDATLAEWSIKLSPTSTGAGDIKFNITNAGTMNHDLSILELNKTSAQLPAGASETWDAGKIPAGEYTVICSIPGHREQGMETKLTVGGGGSSGSGGSGGGASSASTGAKIDANAHPGDNFKARDPEAPATPEGTFHDITFEAREGVIEVAPGVTQQMWTFNEPGQDPAVPGPILRGNIGDTFRVTLVNKGTIDHSMDFHASMVAWSDEMRSIAPGEELIYEFTATRSGIFMYHCGTSPALMHIGSGMYGAIIINPPNLPAVDHEYVFVQSELYLGPEGGNADMQKMLDSKWDAVVFNGYFNQYAFQPIQVQPNERIRAWVMNDGPTNATAWHVIGSIFDTSYFEGNYLLKPPDPGGSQALGLQPAQGGFVEFTLAEEGFYPFVTHRFADTGKGAMGLFRAGDPPPLAGSASH